MNRCRLFTTLAALSVAFAASANVRAQTTSTAPDMPGMASGQMSAANSSMPAPPNILMIETDNIKPYNTTPYDKVAADYVAVARKANLPGMVIAMEACPERPARSTSSPTIPSRTCKIKKTWG